MSKKRTAVKYTAASALTLVYGAGAYYQLTAPPVPGEQRAMTNRQAVIAVASLVGLTWLVAVL